MSTIEQELKDTISRHLPQQVGDALQERLKKADRDAEDNAKLQLKINDLNAKLSERDVTIGDLRDELKEHADLAQREIAVEARERAAEVAELKIRLAAAEGNTQFAKDVALGLVRNIEYRSGALTNRESEIAMPGSNGGPGYPHRSTLKTDESTTTTAS